MWACKLHAEIRQVPSANQNSRRANKSRAPDEFHDSSSTYLLTHQGHEAGW